MDESWPVSCWFWKAQELPNVVNTTLEGKVACYYQNILVSRTPQKLAPLLQRRSALKLFVKGANELKDF